MVKVEFGMVKDKFWNFYTEGAEQPEIVQVKSVRGKTVDLSNGVSIRADDFYAMCEPAFDETPMVSEEQQENEMLMEGLEDILDTGGENSGPAPDIMSEVMSGIQFDANGIPIMGPSQPQRPIRPQSQPQHQPQPQKPVQHQSEPQSPLIALTERGKTKITKLNFSLEFPTVDKTLFNALMDTYPEEEIDLLLEHFINKVGIDNIKTIIKQRVLQHYKPKRDATS